MLSVVAPDPAKWLMLKGLNQSKLQRITLNASLFSWKVGNFSSFSNYLQEVAEQSVFLFFKNLDAVSAFGGKFCRYFISPGDSGRYWDQTCDLRMIRRVFCYRAVSSLAIIVICPVRHLSCGLYY
jgi:hypothetical protein